MHLYNDNEQFCWSWLRRLVAAGHLPAGEVDARAVQWFTPDEVRSYTSAHFFAGIGGWPLALRMAGWPDDEPVWTASLPCQPFSNAGKRRGVDDERHLWPVFRRLVEECRPPVIFGEQVASRDGREWLAGVRADLEALGYAVGTADLCAAGVGAPHIRQRLFWGASLGWVGHPEHDGSSVVQQFRGAQEERRMLQPERPSTVGGLAQADLEVQGGRGVRGPGKGQGEGAGASRERSAGLRATGGVAHADQGERGRVTDGQGCQHDRPPTGRQQGDGVAQPGGAGGYSPGVDGPRGAGHRAVGVGGDDLWRSADWIYCQDNKLRRAPAEPALFPLAHGVPGRVGQLRAYGNAIIPQVAATFIRAFMGSRHD